MELETSSFFSPFAVGEVDDKCLVCLPFTAGGVDNKNVPVCFDAYIRRHGKQNVPVVCRLQSPKIKNIPVFGSPFAADEVKIMNVSVYSLFTASEIENRNAPVFFCLISSPSHVEIGN